MKVILCAVLAAAAATGSAAPAEVTVEGAWQVKIQTGNAWASLPVDKPEWHMKMELIPSLPLYNPKGAEYARGAKLSGVRAQECSVRYALDPASLVVRLSVDGAPLVRGKDYEAELTWGCVGRLEGGAIGAGTRVWVSYEYGSMRLDSVVQRADRQIELRKGVSHLANPEPPALAAGEMRLANIWVTARLTNLTEACLFPVLESAYPEAPKTSPAPAERFIPKTLAKLNAGGKVRILAWGDSVTDGGFLPERDVNRWQEQFARRLRARYPKAEIVLMTEAWGGRNTDSYRNEPAGSVHNYKEKVLDLKPDLIVSEFVNDAGLNEAGVYQRYGRIRDEFTEIGA